jgi:hypothetical protein
MTSCTIPLGLHFVARFVWTMKCRALPAMKQGCLRRRVQTIISSVYKKSWDDNMEEEPQRWRIKRSTFHWRSDTDIRHTRWCRAIKDHGELTLGMIIRISVATHGEWINIISPWSQEKPLRMSRRVDVFVTYIINNPTHLSLCRVIYDYAIRVSSGTLIVKIKRIP